MGWYTQINIIVENIHDPEQAVALALALYETDAKTYYGNEIHFVKYRACNDGTHVLFFTYERRKYLPYWTVQEVSKTYPQLYFTVVASCPDFIGGPAGIVKISNGIITDSYGFWDRIIDLDNPSEEALYQWFGKNRFEENYRELYIEKQPKGWIDEIYIDNIIDFNDEQLQSAKELIDQTNTDQTPWTALKMM